MEPAYNVLAAKIKKAPLPEIVRVLKMCYLYGVADGAEAEVAEGTDRFLRIKTDTHYETECPACQTWLELDLLGLLKDNGEN